MECTCQAVIGSIGYGSMVLQRVDPDTGISRQYCHKWKQKQWEQTTEHEHKSLPVNEQHWARLLHG